MIVASQCRVKMVEFAVISEQSITVPARNITSERIANVSCTSVWVMFNTFSYIY